MHFVPHFVMVVFVACVARCALAWQECGRRAAFCRGLLFPGFQASSRGLFGLPGAQKLKIAAAVFASCACVVSFCSEHFSSQTSRERVRMSLAAYLDLRKW
ncbi:unnamed protein product [Polarella glacialis]|uniref:Secreted protein n=1 Tax=Polarella glacialis TaxID=89957 RepID=A0A813HNF7_POLGL|nr:unnamed protein product [Polarella glacialis]